MSKKIFLIGEVGINHNGSLSLAKKIILAAKKNGFDAVKFQKRNPEISVPDNKKDELKNTPWGTMTYLKYKKKIEFEKKEYDQIDKYCKKLKIDWFASPWDIDSLDFLKQYNLKYNKVPSAMLTNLDLLKAIAKEKKYTFISTGMSNMKQIETAINIFKKNKCKFAILHCVSSYPAKDKDLNLNMIKTLKDKFKCDVGYSGHEKSVNPSVYAAVLGARYIERHITIDRTLWGTDQSASLEINGMALLSELTSKIDILLGDGKKTFLPDEKLKLKSMKYW